MAGLRISVARAFNVAKTHTCSLRREALLRYSSTMEPVTVKRGPLEGNERHKWKILAATCLQRFPTLCREKNDLERRFEEFQDTIRFEKSRLCDYELEEIEEEKNRIELEQKALEEDLSDVSMQKSDQRGAFEDMKEARETELRQFKPASRQTEADNRDIKSTLNRRLDRVLYLVVRAGGQWMMPTREWSGEQSLVEVG